MTLQLRSLLIPLSLLILHLLLRVILAFRVCWILSWPFRQLMVSFWWMRSQSFWHCKRIWQAFGGLLHHLLLMMSLDCPLAIHHKKREYIWMEIRGDFCFLFFVFLELWSFRFYLGASWCIYFFGSWCIYFYGMYMLRGDIMFFIFIFLLSILLFLVSHVLHWLLIYIYEVIYDIYLFILFYIFMLYEIKNLFCFTCIFHTCVCVFVKCYRNI